LNEHGRKNDEGNGVIQDWNEFLQIFSTRLGVVL
ncbi:unnamed protein product, partial [Allacma fusca]